MFSATYHIIAIYAPVYYRLITKISFLILLTDYLVFNGEDHTHFQHVYYRTIVHIQDYIWRKFLGLCNNIEIKKKFQISSFMQS